MNARTKDTSEGAVRGMPRLILQAEGAAVMAAAVGAYAAGGWGWGAFAVLFLAPDLAMLGYLAGTRVGAAVYNAGHSYLGPILLLALGQVLAGPGLVALGLIWAAHIGFDRMLGYGLKYPWGFRATHLSAEPAATAGAPATPSARA